MVITFAFSAFDLTDELDDIATYTLTLDPHTFKNLDKAVDSITSNIKMQVLSYVRNHYPHVWHKDSPVDLNALSNLQLDEPN